MKTLAEVAKQLRNHAAQFEHRDNTFAQMADVVEAHYAPIGWEDEKAMLEEKVAKLTLAEHPADDDELVTEEWALSLPGAENAMSRNAVTVVWGEPSERIYISAARLQICGTVLKLRNVTRGDVRRLFRALGLELR